jgi:hypothetical protein
MKPVHLVAKYEREEEKGAEVPLSPLRGHPNELKPNH